MLVLGHKSLSVGINYILLKANDANDIRFFCKTFVEFRKFEKCLSNSDATCSLKIEIYLDSIEVATSTYDAHRPPMTFS